MLDDEEFVEGQDKDMRDLELLATLRKSIEDGQMKSGVDDDGMEDSWTREEERRAKRCFTHLEALCLTGDAKSSLKVRF